MRRIRLLPTLGLLAVLGTAGVWWLHRLPVDVPPPPDYALSSSWLCRPSRADACSQPTTATVFEPNGSEHAVTYANDPATPIDCFYVYPTVSEVRAAYAPIAATAAEERVVRHQLARFGAVCRLYAPLYRQVTGAGLPLLFGGRRGVSVDVPYADVLAAWRSYLAKDNGGRGIVLIGHSQGARLLARLVKEEIDGTPLAGRLVSAIVPGTQVLVPDGARVGGLYRRTPLCATAQETGCVIAYSSFLADRKMPADARFGESHTPGQRYACVDPAALLGAKTLDADLPVPARLKDKIDTDFAEVPGVLSATCREDGPFSILAVSVAPIGHVGARTQAVLERVAEDNPTTGLHPLDISLALGSLVEVVREQSAAYSRTCAAKSVPCGRAEASP